MANLGPDRFEPLIIYGCVTKNCVMAPEMRRISEYDQLSQQDKTAALHSLALEDIRSHLDAAEHQGNRQMAEEQVQQVLEDSVERGAEILDDHHVSFEELPAVVYNPEMNGSAVNGETALLEVGKRGEKDATYHLLKQVTHELVHYKMKEEGASTRFYDTREEALAQLWSLYFDGRIEDKAERQEKLKRLQKPYDEMKEGRGQKIVSDAFRYLDRYEKDWSGPPHQRMTFLIHEHIQREIDSAHLSIGEQA